MRHTTEERLSIGKKIYDNEISKYEASAQYGISVNTAREYMRLYRDTNHLPPKNKIQPFGNITPISAISPPSDLAEYESMTKEELIKELVKSRVNEMRLKKGYEVKGAGVEKVFIPLDNENTK